jgi:hypothetical protein
MAKLMQKRMARKARRNVDGNFHIRSIGGDVRPVPGLGTPDGERMLSKLADHVYGLARRSAAQRRRTVTR